MEECRCQDRAVAGLRLEWTQRTDAARSQRLERDGRYGEFAGLDIRLLVAQLDVEVPRDLEGMRQKAPTF